MRKSSVAQTSFTYSSTTVELLGERTLPISPKSKVSRGNSCSSALLRQLTIGLLASCRMGSCHCNERQGDLLRSVELMLRSGSNIFNLFGSKLTELFAISFRSHCRVSKAWAGLLDLDLHMTADSASHDCTSCMSRLAALLARDANNIDPGRVINITSIAGWSPFLYIHESARSSENCSAVTVSHRAKY